MTLTQSIAEHPVDGDARALFEEARRRRRRRWVLGVVIIVAAATVASVSITGGDTGRVAHTTSSVGHVVSAPQPAPFLQSPEPPCGSSTPVGGVDAIDFVDADNGFGFTLVPALGGGMRGGDYDELVTTHDAGTTWVPVCPTSGPSVFSHGYLSIEQSSDRTRYPSQELLFTSPMTGYLWGPLGVARTTDGGTTWTATLDGDVDGLAASSGQMWAAVNTCPPVADSGTGCHGDVRVSRDDGRSWNVLTGTASTGDNDAAVAAGTAGTFVVADLHAIGQNTGPVPGLLLVTTNGGTSFRSRSFSCPPYATSVQVAVAGPANALWLTCWGGVAETSWLALSRSIDLTATPVPVATSVDSPASGFANTLPGRQPEQLVVTSATDATVLMGFTTENSGPAGLYQTDDGGQSWHSVWPVTTLNGAFGGDVDFVNATDGWAAVPNDGPGLFLHTTDGGRTWVTA
jgi:photosystem II stability/assembly factor-like uncharacterized protein